MLSREVVVEVDKVFNVVVRSDVANLLVVFRMEKNKQTITSPTNRECILVQS